MTMRGLYIILIFLIFLPGVKSENLEKTGPLDSLIQIALKNNPDILGGKLMLESAEFGSKAAGTLPDPMLSIAAMNLPRKSLALDKSSMSGIVVGFMQTIPWPGMLKTEKAMARLKTATEGQNLLLMENQIARMIKQFYYEYSYWTYAEQVLDTNIRLVQTLMDISETKYANGFGTAQDVLQAQTARAQLENRKLQIFQMKQSSLLGLGQLISDTLTISKKLPAELPEKLELFADGDESKNPLLQNARLQTAMEQKQISLAKAGYYPEIALGLEYTFRQKTAMDELNGENFLTAKIDLQLPLWFFARQKNETKAAHLAAKASKEKYRSIQLDLEQQISTMKLILRAFGESAEQYRTSIIPQAKAAFEAAQIAYEVGKVDFNTLSDAQMDLYDFELERFELIKNYWQKQAELVELYGLK
jgi:cobalt-zinc-cadmium efflux system outer membrane protein